jgi:alpha-galactosidase/6-phospho-beta-glucosidase family protein
MTLRITMVGGGSTHWTPTLLVDFANSPVLRDAEVTLVDTATETLPPMVELAGHIARARGIGLGARAAGSLDEGLEGADVVLTTLSVGGFASMACDIEVPYRYGIRQPVGDTVGPGGIFRSLRSVPVMVDIARAVERVAPGALLVNVSNPLTSLCRAVTRETGVRAVGLCNELVGLSFVLSLLFDVGFDKIDPVVGGVNHLPLVTALTIDGRDGLAMLRDLVEDPGDRAAEPIWMDPPAAMHWRKRSEGDKWTKGDVLAGCSLKLELFRRFGVLPGSADTHVSEFFPWFLTPRSDFGRDWGVHHYGMAGHRADKEADNDHLVELRGSTEIPPWPSGELVATLLEGVATGEDRTLPVNLPNAGQVANLPHGVVVECIGVAGAEGVRARDTTAVTGMLGSRLEQIVASQELTVEAALSGSRTTVLEAMFCDPVVSALPYEDVVAMTDELLAATSAWLPRFTAPA